MGLFGKLKLLIFSLSLATVFGFLLLTILSTHLAQQRNTNTNSIFPQVQASEINNKRDGSTYCKENDWCSNNVCVHNKCYSGSPGDPCEGDNDCPSANNRCVDDLCRTGTQGDKCEKQSDCNSDLFCPNYPNGYTGNPTCANKLDDGKVCVTDVMCKSGDCSGKTWWNPFSQDSCQAKDKSVPVGGTCNSDSECVFETCVKNECTSRENDAKCESAKDCNSNWCVDGFFTCQPYGTDPNKMPSSNTCKALSPEYGVTEYKCWIDGGAPNDWKKVTDSRTCGQSGLGCYYHVIDKGSTTGTDTCTPKGYSCIPVGNSANDCGVDYEKTTEFSCGKSGVACCKPKNITTNNQCEGYDNNDNAFKCFSSACGTSTSPWTTTTNNSGVYSCSGSSAGTNCCKDQAAYSNRRIQGSPGSSGGSTGGNTTPPAGPGFCGGPNRENPQGVNTPPSSCTINNSDWDQKSPNGYCSTNYPNLAEYYYKCPTTTSTPTPSSTPYTPKQNGQACNPLQGPWQCQPGSTCEATCNPASASCTTGVCAAIPSTSPSQTPTTSCPPQSPYRAQSCAGPVNTVSNCCEVGRNLLCVLNDSNNPSSPLVCKDASTSPGSNPPPASKPSPSPVSTGDACPDAVPGTSIHQVCRLNQCSDGENPNTAGDTACGNFYKGNYKCCQLPASTGPAGSSCNTAGRICDPSLSTGTDGQNTQCSGCGGYCVSNGSSAYCTNKYPPASPSPVSSGGSSPSSGSSSNAIPFVVETCNYNANPDHYVKGTYCDGSKTYDVYCNTSNKTYRVDRASC